MPRSRPRRLSVRRSGRIRPGGTTPSTRGPRAGDRRQAAGQAGQGLPRQPGEGHGLDVVRVQPVHGGGLHHHAGQARGQARHQQRVAHPAAAHQHPRGARLVRAQRIGGGGRAQLQQGGLHVGRGLATAQPRLHPLQVEVLAAGALGRWQGEPGLGPQPCQQRLVHRAAGGERAAGVVGGAGVALAPGIEQGVGRAGVEAAHRAGARQQGVVADAAEVEHRAVLVRRMQQRGVEGRHQRRALAAGGHIAAAEVAHGGDAGALGDHRAVADLQGEGRLPVRTVADGLAVRADRRHLRRGDPGLLQQRPRGGGEGPAHLHVQSAQLVQRAWLAALADGHQTLAQGRLPRVGAGGHQAQAGGGRAVGELDQRGVDAVGAGAGDQAKEEMRHARHCRRGARLSRACPPCRRTCRRRRRRTSASPSAACAPGSGRSAGGTRPGRRP